MKTSHLTVRVLGTKFSVNAYDSVQSIVLTEGSVAVRDNNEKNAAKMLPNEMYTYNSTTGERSIKPVDSSKYISWTEGHLLLEKTPLNEVIIRLQQFYGTKIVFDAERSSWIPISGKLELRHGLDSALDHLKRLAPISYTYNTEDEITIRNK